MTAGSEASESGSATVEAPVETDAEAAVRSAIPAIEAYYADNQTYAGAERAVEIYGVTLGAVRIVVLKNGQAYCVEAPAGARAGRPASRLRRMPSVSARMRCAIRTASPAGVLARCRSSRIWPLRLAKTLSITSRLEASARSRTMWWRCGSCPG